MTILVAERSETDASEPRRQEMCWHDVCRPGDLEPGWGEAAWLDGLQVALYRFPDGSFYAAEQRCPATGANVMARGIMGSRATAEGMVHTVASPLHKQVFRLDDGRCLGDDALSLKVFRTQVRDGRLWVGVPR